MYHQLVSNTRGRYTSLVLQAEFRGSIFFACFAPARKLPFTVFIHNTTARPSGRYRSTWGLDAVPSVRRADGTAHRLA